MEDLKNMFPDPFNKVSSMADKYLILLDPKIPSVQHGRCRVPIEAKEDMEIKLREMTVQDIITPQVEPTP